MTEAQKKATKKYNELHREEIRGVNKLHYQRNKTKILSKLLEKVECKVCNIDITKGNKSRHEATKAHLSKIQEKDDDRKLHRQYPNEKEYREILNEVKGRIDMNLNNTGYAKSLTDRLRNRRLGTAIRALKTHLRHSVNHYYYEKTVSKELYDDWQLAKHEADQIERDSDDDDEELPDNSSNDSSD
jgi:hypothetical protein